MRKAWAFLFLVFALVILSINLSFAGVGISSSQTTLSISNGGRGCITYGLTNPFAEDSKAGVIVEGDASQFLVSQSVEVIELPAGTMPEEAKPAEFCFKARISKEVCTGEFIEYKGNVVAGQVTEGAVSGSMASAAVSSPLNLRVYCSGDEGVSLRHVLLASIILLLIILVFLIYRFYFRNRKTNHHVNAKNKKRR